MEDKKEIDNLTNLNSIHLEQVYSQLMQIKHQILICQNGFSTIQDMIQASKTCPNCQINFEELKLNNFRLLISTFRSLMNDIKKIISKTLYDKIMKVIELVEKGLKNENDNPFFKTITNAQTKTLILQTKNMLQESISHFEVLRGELMSELSNLLYLKEEAKPKGFEKKNKLGK